ncbi:MAG: N-acetyltransferase [Gammaproteobacteria bacterium]|nr:N-acetyltransferase [Gammaproteobacteria bacterium]
MRRGFQVRPEGRSDLDAIRTVNREAFGSEAEADLVDALRANGEAALSLVAENDSGVVGHILFSHLPIRTSARDVAAVALAPMSVLPRWQRRGVGSALVRTGLDRCREAGLEAVVVLGHPTYYPRFGFSARLAEPLQAPFSGPAFMALELVPGALSAGGVVHYPDAFLD